MSDFPLMDTKTPMQHGLATAPTVVSSLSNDAHVITTTSRFCAIFNQEGVTEVEMRVFGEPSDKTAKWDPILLNIANSLTFTPPSASQPADK